MSTLTIERPRMLEAKRPRTQSMGPRLPLGFRFRAWLLLTLVGMSGAARTSRPASQKANDAVPFIIVVAIVVLLALGATVVIGAVALCAANGGVLNFVIQLDPWMMEVHCVRL